MIIFMIGKRIKISDYKFTYGEDTVYINVFGVFKNTKNGNKYIVYSYDNKKLFYGSFFVRDSIGTIMISKDTDIEIIKSFINSILSGSKSNGYETVDLNDINSIQVIDEMEYDSPVDIDKLNDLTIPKDDMNVLVEQPKKKIPLFIIGIILLFIVIGLFLFINPEVFAGKNTIYSCSKVSNHKELPASMVEERTITFNSKGTIKSMNIVTDYKFSDIEFYTEFKNKSYFYKYIEEADTYKFDDVNYIYRVFSNVDVDTNYFLPDTESELISYFKNEGYICRIKEE